jgi:hypothetical protein
MGSVAYLNARSDPDSSIAVPHRPAKGPVTGRTVDRFSVVNSRTTRHGRAQDRAGGKSAEKTRGETISRRRLLRCDTTDGDGSCTARNRNSLHDDALQPSPTVHQNRQRNLATLRRKKAARMTNLWRHASRPFGFIGCGICFREQQLRRQQECVRGQRRRHRRPLSLCSIRRNQPGSLRQVG